MTGFVSVGILSQTSGDIRQAFSQNSRVGFEKSIQRFGQRITPAEQIGQAFDIMRSIMAVLPGSRFGEIIIHIISLKIRIEYSCIGTPPEKSGFSVEQIPVIFGTLQVKFIIFLMSQSFCYLSQTPIIISIFYRFGNTLASGFVTGNITVFFIGRELISSCFIRFFTKLIGFLIIESSQIFHDGFSQNRDRMKTDHTIGFSPP